MHAEVSFWSVQAFYLHCLHMGITIFTCGILLCPSCSFASGVVSRMGTGRQAARIWAQLTHSVHAAGCWTRRRLRLVSAGAAEGAPLAASLQDPASLRSPGQKLGCYTLETPLNSMCINSTFISLRELLAKQLPAWPLCSSCLMISSALANASLHPTVMLVALHMVQGASLPTLYQNSSADHWSKLHIKSAIPGETRHQVS